MKHSNRNVERKAQRQEEAKNRAGVRSVTSDQEQLAKLDRKLGAGVGAKKERARLVKRIIKAAEKGKA
jgi:hypothetical protein